MQFPLKFVCKGQVRYSPKVLRKQEDLESIFCQVLAQLKERAAPSEKRLWKLCHYQVLVLYPPEVKHNIQ